MWRISLLFLLIISTLACAKPNVAMIRQQQPPNAAIYAEYA